MLLEVLICTHLLLPPMHRSKKHLLIIGIFWNGKKFKTARQAPDQLAEAFEKTGYNVIRTSFYVNKYLRLADTVATIIGKKSRYELAIVPWFNGRGSFYWQEIASRLLKLLNKKIVLVIHGGSIPAEILAAPHKYSKTLKRADVIVSPSAFVADKLSTLNYKIEVIENVLDLEQYPFQPKTRFGMKLLWMRTIEPLYNPEMALEVVRILKEKGYTPKMYMAGQQKDQALFMRLQQLISEWQLNENIFFTGYADHQKKLTLASDCDIYICTNKVDNAPVSLVEMMSLGLPVVSTNVGGIPYLVRDGVNGLLVNDGDAQAMAERIETIHLDSSLASTLTANGAEFAKAFDTQPVVAKWERLFHRLLGNTVAKAQHPL
jgi:glycosyltransferase involved in cell wall biosynthesis